MPVCRVKYKVTMQQRLVLLLCLSSSLVFAQDQNEVQRELSQLKGQIQQTENELKEQQKAFKAAQESLQSADQSLAKLARQMRQINADLTELQKQQAQLEAEQRLLQKSFELQQSLLAQQVKAAYVTGQHDYTKMLLNQQDSNKLERVLTYYQYLAQARVQQLSQIEHLDQTLQNKAQLQQQLRAQLEQQQLELTEAKSTQQASVKKIKSFLQDQQQQLNYLKQNEQSLQSTLNKLKSAAIAAKKRLDLPKTKGQLPWPVQGDILQGYGEKRLAGVSSQGILIAAAEGSRVKAVADGQVIYADWLKGYGWVIVLDHGNGVMSLYGHNQTLLKKPGESVTASDAVALVGASGGQAQAGLYFEIRQKGSAINPITWLQKHAGS
jgi:murein hydrolase activator